MVPILSQVNPVQILTPYFSKLELKLPVCLIMSHAIKTHGEQSILNLGTTYRSAVSFILRPLSPRAESILYAFHTLDRPKAGLDATQKRKISDPIGESDFPIVQQPA